jgi:L-fuconolactonase
MIDAHRHYWDPARGDYGWIEPGSAFDRPFLPEHLAGADPALLVQAAPTLAETDWLLNLAERTPGVLGVVGWVDLNADDVADRMAERVPRGLKGVRPMLQDLPDPDWIVGPEREPGLRAVVEAGLVFDALVRPGGLRAIATLAERHPDLSIVLDHAGKPPVGTPGMDRWRDDLAQVELRPNCRCKLSGLLTEAPAGTPDTVIEALVREIANLWGRERLIWGSDWPVLTLAGHYAGWRALCRRVLGEDVAVFGGNAREVYGL